VPYRYGVPGVGLVVQAVWARVLTISGTFSDLVDYVTFVELLFLALSVAAVFACGTSSQKAPDPIARSAIHFCQ
jgi:APA family basic amino acid/polyamine antiporter